MNKKEIEELKDKYSEEAVNAYIDILGGEEYIDNFEDAYLGEWADDEDFVKDLIEDTGELPKDFPDYIHIDWERTAKDVMMDYSESNGYYFRNL